MRTALSRHKKKVTEVKEDSSGSSKKKVKWVGVKKQWQNGKKRVAGMKMRCSKD